MTPVDFNVKLESLLERTENYRKPIEFAGDFNYNLINYNKHEGTTQFLDTLHHHNFIPHIVLPTRLTTKSSTLIDNIFLNSLDHTCLSDNLSVSISDHLPQYLLLNNFFANKSAPPQKKKNMETRLPKFFRRRI